ncbi:MAG: fatty acid desaturase family protein [Acidimicrobiales bacterium]
MRSGTISEQRATYRALALEIRAAGLLDRRRAYYAIKIALSVAALAGSWAALVVVGNSWATLGIAAFLGVVFTQLGFIGHDAGHQQVFASRHANRMLGLLVGNAMIGLSFGWWVPKHSAHHAHPNEVGRDPDIGDGLFTAPAMGATTWRERVVRLLVRWQAPLFFPLMLLRSVGLHVSGVQQLLRRRDAAAIREGLLLAFHAALYLTLLLVVLSPLKALAFLVVQQAVFSVYLGCSFAPNHKGMPVIGTEAQLGFAARQVMTARNVSGGALVTFVLGGLNYQIEHHLFPAMPRPNLRRAQRLVRDFCEESELGYCEATVAGSFRRIIHHLQEQAAAATGFGEHAVICPESAG